MRRPLVVALVLAAAVVAGGCDDGSGGSGGGSAASPGPVEPPVPEGTDLLAPGVPAPAVPLCGAYAALLAALDRSEEVLPDDPAAPVPSAFVAAFHDLGADLATLALPSSLTDDEADGVGVVSRASTALPDDATAADLRDLDADLDATQRRQVEAIDAYVDRTCALS